MEVAMKRMFSVNRLNITGTDEQIAKYASDTKAFDYVKYALEGVVNSIKKSKEKSNDFQCAYLKPNTYLTIVKNAKEDQSSLMIYHPRTKTFDTNIAVDDLEALKQTIFQEEIIRQINANRKNLVSDDIIKKALGIQRKTQLKKLPDITFETNGDEACFALGE